MWISPLGFAYIERFPRLIHLCAVTERKNVDKSDVQSVDMDSRIGTWVQKTPDRLST